MIRNYIKIAFRNLWKDRTFTALNIIGLTTAFGIAFLLSMYALFELSYDRFHENIGSIYKVYTDEQTAKGTESSETNPIPFADALREEVPGVDKISRYVTGGTLLTYDGETFQVTSAGVDPEYFDIFSFPIVEGNKTNPISEKLSIVISRKVATAIFGKEMPIGKTVMVQSEGENVPVGISAVFENIPAASSMDVDVIVNIKNLPDSFYKNNLNNWSAHNHAVYMKLANGISPAQFEKSTKDFSALHYAENIANAKRDGAQADAKGNFRQIKLLPVEDQSFVVIKDGLLSVNKTLQYIVLGIAFLILFIASVNFINMSLAKSAQRLREIGMRKTLGAGKSQLFIQFWGESVIVFIVAVVLGGFLAFTLLKPFQTLFNTSASFSSISNPLIVFGAILCVLLITLIAGGYPAFMMSRMDTLQALKAKLKVNGNNRLRNVLMVVQFSIAIILISGTIVLWQQLDYLRNKDLGFNKEQVISFPINTKQDPNNVLQLLRNEFSTDPNILSVSAADNNFGLGRDGSRMRSVLGFDYKNRQVSTHLISVDYDYAETLDIELLEGRSFNRKYASDSLSVMINEAMVKELGEENPLNANLFLGDSIKYSVIGIVKNFNFESLSRGVQPLTLFMDGESPMGYVYVKVVPNNLADTYAGVRKVWNKIEPDTEFLGSFLDENIDRTLKRERHMTTMISSGSILAIILSCIGLFAISLLVVSQRRKEIGIRKVVGASVSTITVLLTKDFLKLVGIAFLIATPIAWYATSKWLENYVYRIDLNLWIFLAAGVMALIIAVLTISFRTIQAALKNPVESLKTE
ncbi:ABC transporter permease [Gelidibacter maritimus]|uniref:ABC transporter permease n=1 Tax=Gelidibacter maritimus TaxID=2761487 RepID=A0A7W2R288_9FLAO|nr:ABC transporter permease [Gelidibacter maritimus]MBA6151556.1 ABC transporter permease [Gelidibacter maritimus]